MTKARRPSPGSAGRHAVLYPGVAEAAHRVGAGAVGLVDVRCSAGFNLVVDRVGITYSNGQSSGDPFSSVQVSAALKGRRPLPDRAIPPVVARIGIDARPVDVTDPDDVRWLRAGVPPDQPDLVGSLDAEIALTASARPLLLTGDALGVLQEAVARVPGDALPVVTTTWALSHLTPERRTRFLQRLGEVAATRPLAWVSVEGVGVAPAVPTMGDRRASGHSIIALALLDHRTVYAEALGRCWSRGSMLSWLA